eukprot:5180820-Alexandrium_andersonii.AAC.1
MAPCPPPNSPKAPTRTSTTCSALCCAKACKEQYLALNPGVTRLPNASRKNDSPTDGGPGVGDPRSPGEA